ncbi:DUF362 domain-containing protein [Methanocella paludicola]|nr:DUF362 domain-containing protein [Methanocella paludicola]
MAGRWAKEVLERGMSRRSFLKAAVAAAAVAVTGCVSASEPSITPVPSIIPSPTSTATQSRLVVTTDPDPARLVDRALDAFGALPIKKDDRVFVKANFSFSRTVDQAASNHPQVLVRLMERCREAGASEVIAFDHTIDSSKLCLERSGIKAAVEKAGFTAIAVNSSSEYEERQIDGPTLKKTRIARILKDADVLINAPVVKSHGNTRLTAGMKNLMGVIDNRGAFHSSDLDGCIADLSYVIRPTLTVADAYRVLKSGGPNGGSPEDITHPQQLIVGYDPVAVDSYAATLLGLTGNDIEHVVRAYQRGLGEIDLGKVNVQKVV